MPTPLQFHFEFSSPYAYLASEQIEPLAARYGRIVEYMPVLLGAVFKVSGGAPLTDLYGPKAGYAMKDFERSARFAGVPYRQPSRFPVASLTATRAGVWLQQHRPEQAAPFIHAVYRAFFVDDRNISEAAVVSDIAHAIGIDATQLAAGVQLPEVKDRLKAQVDAAIAAGIFGAPTIIVDGEMFWGNDRLPQIERWLAQGPF